MPSRQSAAFEPGVWRPHSYPTAPTYTAPPGSIDLNDLSRLVDAAASLTSAEDGVLQVGVGWMDGRRLA